jgi:hypothetical protein
MKNCKFPTATSKEVARAKLPLARTLGRDGAPRRPRPRSSGRNGQAHDIIHAPRCAAEHGADGASASSLPRKTARLNHAPFSPSHPNAPARDVSRILRSTAAIRAVGKGFSNAEGGMKNEERDGETSNIQHPTPNIEMRTSMFHRVIQSAKVGRVTPCAPRGNPNLCVASRANAERRLQVGAFFPPRRRRDLFVVPPTQRNPSPVKATYSAKIISCAPSTHLPGEVALDGDCHSEFGNRRTAAVSKTSRSACAKTNASELPNAFAVRTRCGWCSAHSRGPHSICELRFSTLRLRAFASLR